MKKFGGYRYYSYFCTQKPRRGAEVLLKLLIMDYCIEIVRQFNDEEVRRGIQTWPQVVSILRDGLYCDTVSARIEKYSSDGKRLASRVVSMKNIVKVATSLTDKCLTSK